MWPRWYQPAAGSATGQNRASVRSAQAVDQSRGIGRWSIGPPSHMAVRAHQHQALLVERGSLGLVQCNGREWHPTCPRRLLDRLARRRALKSQQGEPAAVEVENGAAIAQDDMRR